jgi:hypothetical protein
LEEAFESEEELATFLLKNPSWKPYFRDGTRNGQHLAAIVP